jgi:proline dehydrogenase
LFIHLPIEWIIKRTIFAQFCGGETIENCEKTIQKLHDYQIGTILDYSVEGAKDEKSFEKTAKEIIHTIHKAAQKPDTIPFCVFKITGVISFELLEKIQEKKELTLDEAAQWEIAQQRVDGICKEAFQKNIKILIDGEESWIQETIDSIAYQMMIKYNKERAIVFNTYQMYLKNSLSNLRAALTLCVRNNIYLGAKIVRGAYMEKERKRATEKKYPDPVQNNKEATDADFEKALYVCVDNNQRIVLCAGTHNEQSSLYLTMLLDRYNISPTDQRVYFAQLFGMSDHISYNLAKAGYNVAKYVPYGPVRSVMPYLFRRASENTSVAGQSSREFTLVNTELKRRRNLK